jgi:outer membrane protein
MNRSMPGNDKLRYFEKILKAVQKIIMMTCVFLLLSNDIPNAGEMPQAAILKFPAGKIDPPGKMVIALRDFVRLVMEKNEQIAFQDAEWVISREAVKGAQAIFEPAFVGSYVYQEDKRRNTVQELVSQGFAPEFQERSRSYQAAVEGLVPTGGRLRVGYTLRDFSNSINERFGVDRESQTVFGASIVQPLLRGGGVKATMAGIEVAKTDESIAFQNYRGQTIRVISDAISSYWDLYLAREKYRIRKESEHNAMEILRENQIRVRTGKMAESEILEAEAGLALRRSLVSDAQQNNIHAMNRVRTFFSASAAFAETEIEPAEPLDSEEIKQDFSDSLSRAFRLRPDYLSSRRKIEREDIRLVFAENQRWPQLDLKGSYNMNGLTDRPRSSWDDAWDRDFDTWYLGLELRIPLGGDRKTRSELEAVRQRKRQALLELQALEVLLANDMDTMTKGVLNARQQVRQYGGIVEMKRRLMEAEIVRYKAGKSNSRLLLEREEELNIAKEAEIDSRVRYRKSLLQLEMAEGSVLVNQGIEEEHS